MGRPSREWTAGSGTPQPFSSDLWFAETVLTDASRLWEHATPDHKRRLQRVLFPEGVTYEPGQAGGHEPP